ncbi:MAG: signal peptidase bacterial type [Clostridiales bacterium]|jgi:signal peptidase I|nr:signal peptidase bacterial type [Clostridiales bacterium]
MKRFFKELGSWVFLIVITVVIAFVISYFVFAFMVFEGSTMSPTISSGDALVINKTSYKFGTPGRFDIIAFKLKEGKKSLVISRIIGLPGETVQIIEGAVYINGDKLEDDLYGNSPIVFAGTADEPILLGKSEYFVLGDNRGSGADSRYIDIGYIKKENIVGKLWIRAFPLGDFGNVDKK